MSASGNSWSDAGATIVGPGPEASVSGSMGAATMQADRIENPARFVLRSENGDVLQEYPLDKQEMTIGRAPNSDILLSKDKLTSRRHATVHYENNNYYLRDEGSANNTFVNGQQIETMTPRLLQNGDHVGIGEHELVFRVYNAPSTGVEDMPTVAVQFDPASADMTYRTRDDAAATAAAATAAPVDDFSTRPAEEAVASAAAKPESSIEASQPEAAPAANNGYAAPVVSTPAPALSVPVATSYAAPAASAAPKPQAAPAPTTSASQTDNNVTFNRLTSLQQPALPDMTALMAALSTLDGQVMSLQEQFNATQEAMRSHDAEISQTTNQLRAGVRKVSERMDSTIADVARSRDSLAWAELRQLMEDVMNNPRDIEYVTKLARKARELNKIFEIQQNVLNTMAECNSLLRGLIGEDK